MVEMYHNGGGNYVPAIWVKEGEVEAPCAGGCGNGCGRCSLQEIFNEYAEMTGQKGKC